MPRNPSTSGQRRPGPIAAFAGFGPNSSGHLEKWVSGVGGLAGILGVIIISRASLGLDGSAALVASMGASAVLLFAVPHGALSQPWAVFGGHLVSAVIGVACAKLITQPLLAPAVAVALAVSAMYYLRCIHPPGGATALTAVAGGPAVHDLGFHFVLTPVLLNVLVILAVAMLFNLPFQWRRYPAAWAPHHLQPAAQSAASAASALSAAVTQTTSTPPGSETRRHTLYDPAQNRAETDGLPVTGVRVGACYCNGEFGPDWQVRRVVDVADKITYRVVAGVERRRINHVDPALFAEWARYEVVLNETSWQRVAASDAPSTTSDDDEIEIHHQRSAV